jgi:hypothetical protein
MLEYLAALLQTFPSSQWAQAMTPWCVSWSGSPQHGLRGDGANEAEVKRQVVVAIHVQDCRLTGARRSKARRTRSWASPTACHTQVCSAPAIRPARARASWRTPTCSCTTWHTPRGVSSRAVCVPHHNSFGHANLCSCDDDDDNDDMVCNVAMMPCVDWSCRCQARQGQQQAQAQARVRMRAQAQA